LEIIRHLLHIFSTSWSCHYTHRFMSYHSFIFCMIYRSYRRIYPHLPFANICLTKVNACGNLWFTFIYIHFFVFSHIFCTCKCILKIIINHSFSPFSYYAYQVCTQYLHCIYINVSIILNVTYSNSIIKFTWRKYAMRKIYNDGAHIFFMLK
jgi:hypothetical protein